MPARIWLGYMNGCGFGGRLRYWEYDQSAAESGVQDRNQTFFTPGATIGSLETNVPGDMLSVSERLHIYTLDAEVFQSMQICCWNVIFGGGIRDAEVDIDRENSYTPAGDTAPRKVADIGNHFDGIGPTLFTELPPLRLWRPCVRRHAPRIAAVRHQVAARHRRFAGPDPVLRSDG